MEELASARRDPGIAGSNIHASACSPACSRQKSRGKLGCSRYAGVFRPREACVGKLVGGRVVEALSADTPDGCGATRLAIGVTLPDIAFAECYLAVVGASVRPVLRGFPGVGLVVMCVIARCKLAVPTRCVGLEHESHA